MHLSLPLLSSSPASFCTRVSRQSSQICCLESITHIPTPPTLIHLQYSQLDQFLSFLFGGKQVNVVKVVVLWLPLHNDPRLVTRMKWMRGGEGGERRGGRGEGRREGRGRRKNHALRTPAELRNVDLVRGNLRWSTERKSATIQTVGSDRQELSLLVSPNNLLHLNTLQVP